MARYAFNQQPSIGYWNCAALAQALLPLLESKEQADSIIQQYPTTFSAKYAKLLRMKFGLSSTQEKDSQLFDQIFSQMHDERTDYTLFFRTLGQKNPQDLFIDRTQFNQWYGKYQDRLKDNSTPHDDIIATMEATNPKYVLRNYLLQRAIERAERGRLSGSE